MAADHDVGHAELAAERPYLVLEQLAQGLDQGHVHALGQAAHVVVGFDGGAGPAGERHEFDDIGVERPLGQEVGAAGVHGLFLEDVDEGDADSLALGLGVGHAGERAEKLVRRRAVHKGDVVVAAKRATTSSPSPATLTPAVLLRSATTTRAPSATNRLQVAAPMPEAPPLTIATRFDNRSIIGVRTGA